MYNLASYQQPITNWQAWLQPDPLPTIPPNDALNTGLGPSTDIYAPVWLQNVLLAWQPPDPLPTLPNQKTPQGAGATITNFAGKAGWQSIVLNAWVPPDPLPTLPVQIGKLYTPSGAPIKPLPVGGNSVYPPKGVLADGAVPVYTTYNTPTGALTPTGANTVSTVTSAGGVIAAVGPINGGYIVNPNTATAQGLGATENLYVDFTKYPGNSDGTANGTTVLIPAGNNPPFTIPPLAAGVSIYVNAPSTGHKFTIVVW